MQEHSTMDAGPALDAEIGRRVFGYHVYHYAKGLPNYWMLLDGDDNPVFPMLNERSYRIAERHSEESAWGDCPRFSTDIAAAWPVVEVFQEQGWSLLLFAWSPHPDRPDAHTARFLAEGIEQGEAHAPTAPLAICRAALAALDHAGAAAGQ